MSSAKLENRGIITQVPLVIRGLMLTANDVNLGSEKRANKFFPVSKIPQNTKFIELSSHVPLYAKIDYPEINNSGELINGARVLDYLGDVEPNQVYLDHRRSFYYPYTRGMVLSFVRIRGRGGDPSYEGYGGMAPFTFVE